MMLLGIPQPIQEFVMRNLMLSAAVLAVALTGCATGPNLAERMSQLVGQPEQVVIQQLGVPNRTMVVRGVTYLAYVRRNTEYIPGSFGSGTFMGPFYGPFFGSYYGGGFPPETIRNRCETTFAVSGGIVRSFALHGNDCS
jgi:hypothetical protein